MTTTVLDLKITADAKAAVNGLKPLTASLEGVTKAADQTESALKDLDKSHTIDVKDQAIENARKELSKLRTQLAKDMDLGLDTKATKKRINELKGDIRALDDKTVHVKAKVDLDSSKLGGGAGKLKSLKGIGQELTSSLTGASGALGGVAEAAGPAGIAIAAVAGASVIAVKGIVNLAQQASGLEQAIGGSDAVFRDTSQAMQDFAKDAAQSAGLSQRAYLEMATVVGAQLKNLGFSISESAAMTAELTARGADLAATFGGSTADAVESIGSALRGEMDPIEKYGISLNQAALNAKALELGLWSGKGALDSHSKAVVINTLIMEQSADAAGQFARESDTLAGQQAKLSAEWENMTTALGGGVLPLVTDFLTVGNFLVQTMGDLTEQGGALNKVWSDLPGPLKAGVKALAASTNLLVGVGMAVHEAAGEIEKMPPKIQVVTEAQQALTKQTNDYAYALGVAGKAAANQQGAIEGLVVGSDEYDKAVGKTLQSLRRLVPALSDFEDEQITGTAITDDQAEAFGNLKTSIDSIQGAVQGSVSSLTDLSDIYKTVTKDGKKAFDAKSFIAEQGKRNKAITDWKKNLATLADRGLSQQVINNLANMGVEGGGKLVDSLANKTSGSQLKKIGKNWTFGQTLGEQIGNTIAIAMVDAMDGKIDGLLNGKKIPVPGLVLPKSHEQKLKSQFDNMIKNIKSKLAGGVRVDADIKAAQKKLKALQAEAEKHPKSKKIQADIAAAEATLRRLKAQAESPLTKPVHADTSQGYAAGAALNSYLSSPVTKKVIIDWPTIPKALNDYLSNPIVTPGQTSIVPQRLADSTTVAGLRGVSSQSIAMTGATQQSSGGSGGPSKVTQLAPKQTPVKIYLDGAEIADHLTLKAGRLATSSSVRRRA
jgi:hypothetical protein